ncbi:nuclease EXOG, mitochondrial isoform X2 [Falco rusticolus]|uniref:nuclease EXOG, mitochondrial isoform X2 n=3 Tax=Falco TaxID=8952 RepID=UPI001886918C|nr:nuclease EXOG, mitochondrial isoform X2 [Falco rusticolus]XP_055563898.1 nuclease EXOG, mitochondrial isoform X2 [Falco cherrug]
MAPRRPQCRSRAGRGRGGVARRRGCTPPPAAMAALPRHRRFLGGFFCGAAAGAAVSCWVAWRLLRSQSQLEPVPGRALPEEPVEESLLEKYGFPEAGTETRYYTNHALSYDQAKRVPRWVIEHISKQKTLGSADRRHCKFRPDPNIPLMFSAVNEDYLGSGWSRGHMAPAGDNKFSTRAMAETFYLSNIVPQNYENNAGFWNRMEMYCRELTQRFEDVWVVSGPLTLPETSDDGKKSVTYQGTQCQNIPVLHRLGGALLTDGALKSMSCTLVTQESAKWLKVSVRWEIQAPGEENQARKREEKSPTENPDLCYNQL